MVFGIHTQHVALVTWVAKNQKKKNRNKLYFTSTRGKEKKEKDLVYM